MTDVTPVLGATTAPTTLGAVLSIPIGQVVPGPNRRGALRNVGELATSIRRLGLREPITVTDLGDGRWQVFEGHRRLAAMQQLGRTDTSTAARWTHIAAVIRVVDDGHRGLLQLAIHAQRLDFDPMAQAETISYEMFERDGDKPSREDVAEALGKTPAWVAGRLQLLKLRPSEREDVSEGRLSVSAALQLLRDRATAGRPTTKPQRPSVPVASLVPPAPAPDPAVVMLKRIRALVGDCVGCSCCQAVGQVLDEAS